MQRSPSPSSGSPTRPSCFSYRLLHRPDRRIAEMADGDLVVAAARNNAEWCDAFCRTHGVVGRFRARFWSSAERTPPFYPDAVTLVADVAVEDVLGCVDAGPGCSVKDSFACLELAPHGFRALFRAEWIARRAGPGSPASGWSAVTTDAQLREWEASWRGAPDASQFFRPALLQDDRIAALAGRDGGRIVAGAIANRSAAVVGLSNVFAPPGQLDAAFAAGADAAEAIWGRVPIVGYESGDALGAAHAAGFESI